MSRRSAPTSAAAAAMRPRRRRPRGSSTRPPLAMQVACPSALWTEAQYPRLPQKRLQSEEETPRKHGDTRFMIVFDVYYRPVFSESLLGFGVSSGGFRDIASSFGRLPPWTTRRTTSPGPGIGAGKANLRTKILDLRGFDSITIVSLRGGIPRSIRNFPESLSQGILVGRLGVLRPAGSSFGRRGEHRASKPDATRSFSRFGADFPLPQTPDLLVLWIQADWPYTARATNNIHYCY